MSELREKLMYKPKHGWDRITAEDKQAMEAYCKDYRAFLDNGKTERLCVDYTIGLAVIHSNSSRENRISERISTEVQANKSIE